jgi:lambda family phage tail tape measure protein
VEERGPLPGRPGQGGWQYGAEQALQDYADNAANMAVQTKSAFSSAFQGMEDALVSFTKTGKLNFSAMADSIISDMIRIQIRQSMSSWMSSLGSAAKSFFSPAEAPAATAAPDLLYAAHGAAFGGDYHAFARGGIVNRPTPFKFASGGAMSSGLMGEAGPEAIMPLRRNAAGDLGIVAAGSSGVGNVRVEIVNQTSQQSQVASATPRFDAEGMVVSIVLRDLNNNGPIRQTLGS